MMSTDPFMTFLLKEICQNLTSENVDGMAFCIRGKVPTQHLEKAKTGIELCRVAMDSNLLSDTNTGVLEEMLEAIRREDLLEKVKNYKTNRTDSSPKIGAPCNIEEGMLRRTYMETKTSQELKDAMETEDGVILSGTSGSGKTQMALQFGYKFHSNHPASTVWMMPSKDPALLQMSMTKLSNELRILEGKTKDRENPINKLGELIAYALLERTADAPHLIIFDDVNESCQKIVVELIQKLIPKKGQRGNIKLIITTIDNLLTVPIKVNSIAVTGFTEEESVSFLSEGKSCKISEEETEALKQLAKRMSYLPLGLGCAKAYMRNCSKSGKAFLKLLNAKTLKRLDGKLKQHDDDNRGLFSNLNAFITIMETDLDEDAIEMFKMTQFLECENIPTVMFELLSPSPECDVVDSENEMQNDAVCCSFSTDSLVQAVQKFSFGTVQGIDDRRTLNMHSAVSLTLAAFTEEESKKRLLKRLLWTFALILDKENRHQDDYYLMVSILPQAKSVLLHAMRLIKDDIEAYILIAFVNDLVAYTSNFEGLLEQERHHSDMSLEYWYKVVGTTATDVDRQVSFQQDSCTTYEEHRKLAKAKAAVIYDKLTTISQQHKTKIQRFIQHFILHKTRTRADVKLLSECFPNYEMGTLTIDQYQTLCEMKKAVPLENLTDTFIKEMMVCTFYTYGRRIFYIGKYADIDEKRKFCHYLFLADELGEMIRCSLPTFTPLYAMLAKRSGTLELVFEEIPGMGLATVDSLQETAKTFERLIGDTSIYYNFGVYKMHAVTDKIHRATCLKQLLRTYIDLIKFDGNSENDKAIIIRKGQSIVSELENVESVCYDPKNSGIWSRIGQFQFVAGDYKEAENAFRHVCPPSVLSSEVESRFLSKHEITASHGLADCYEKEGRHEEAIRILQNLLHVLPEIQKLDKENAQKRMDSIRDKL
ncbi:uncharacterized protein [Argopecten irradians]|uniref:uncharacterized protein n=1 Tax=Argopecten irradians TaxID=31199 RepID=UPI00371F7F77